MSHRTVPAVVTVAALSLLPAALPLTALGAPPAAGPGPTPRAAAPAARPAPDGAVVVDRRGPAEGYAAHYRLEPHHGCPLVELRSADRAPEHVYVCAPRTVRSMET
ncbi:hypothetical protein [Kitasatospora sp. NPDC088346]|uniref:hypothetical protein n=1 Tax=Kitasatospora sp. NPDC088346 TaxID=3364073 RepID=UPI00380329E9